MSQFNESTDGFILSLKKAIFMCSMDVSLVREWIQLHIE